MDLLHFEAVSGVEGVQSIKKDQTVLGHIEIINHGSEE